MPSRALVDGPALFDAVSPARDDEAALVVGEARPRVLELVLVVGEHLVLPLSIDDRDEVPELDARVGGRQLPHLLLPFRPQVALARQCTPRSGSGRGGWQVI